MDNPGKLICLDINGSNIATEKSTDWIEERINDGIWYIQNIKSIGDSLLTAGNRIPKSNIVLYALNGVGHEFDLVVVFLSHNRQQVTF